MKHSFFLFITLVAAVSAYAQSPDTFNISATNPNPQFSNVTCVAGTKYIIRMTGAMSYWRNNVPANELDADGGFVYHIPYVSYLPNDTIDSINSSIGKFQYLPCDGNGCDPVPAEFLCGVIPPNLHTTNIYKYKSVYLDRDYISVNSGEFCPRNGSDETKHIYYMGFIGNGQRAAFQFHDGDGDFVDNWGTLQVTITRLEPIMHIAYDTLDFKKIRPNSFNTPILDDSIYNIGSPFFPGCQGATPDLFFTVDSITGDIGNDGFQVNGLSIGKQLDVQSGGFASEFKSTFSPRQRRPYQAIIWITSTDPQAPHLKVYLIGEGIQGVLGLNPPDTLDFGDVPLNKPSSLPLIIKNIGNDILTVSSIAPDSLDPAFTIPAFTKTTMGINVSSQKIFTFSPSQLKVYYSRVIVSSDGYNDAQHTVVLRGRGVAALLEVDSVLDFGNLPVGNDTVLSLPLQNVGNIPFGVQFVQFSAGDSLDFSAEPRTHIIIEPDSILNWAMGFHPQKPGRRAAVAEIAADGGGAPHYVYVIGNGIVFSKMTTSKRLDYGVVSIETTMTLTAVLKNVGNVPITLQQVSLATGQQWSITTPSFPTMMPKDSMMIDVQFAPQKQQAYSDTLKLTDDSLRSYAIPLTGIGRRFVGVMSVTDTVDFGDVFVGDTTGKILPVSNIGNARLVLKTMTFPLATVDFDASPLLPMRIDTAAFDTVPSFFHPTTAGVKYATYEITDSLANSTGHDSIQHVRDVVFTGNGLPPIIAVLEVDSSYTGIVGQKVTIPVHMLSDISKTNTSTFNTVLSYDGTMLLPLSIATDQLSQNYDLTMNETSPGNLVVTGKPGAGALPISGTGNLFNVTYEVLASVSKITSIKIVNPVVGNGRNPRSVQSIPGLYTTTGQCGSDLTSRLSSTQITDNVPNPFGTTTAVHYIVGVPTHVQIAVYDAVGRKVADLVDDDKPVGTYTIEFNAMNLPNGLYSCRMTAGQYMKTRSMLMMR